MAIQIKTLDQLKLMRKAGLVVGQTLELMKNAIAPGVTTNDLNDIAIKNLILLAKEMVSTNLTEKIKAAFKE